MNSLNNEQRDAILLLLYMIAVFDYPIVDDTERAQLLHVSKMIDYDLDIDKIPTMINDDSVRKSKAMVSNLSDYMKDWFILWAYEITMCSPTNEQAEQKQKLCALIYSQIGTTHDNTRRVIKECQELYKYVSSKLLSQNEKE